VCSAMTDLQTCFGSGAWSPIQLYATQYLHSYNYNDSNEGGGDSYASTQPLCLIHGTVHVYPERFAPPPAGIVYFNPHFLCPS